MLSLFAGREAADAAWRRKAYINRLKEVVSLNESQAAPIPVAESPVEQPEQSSTGVHSVAPAEPQVRVSIMATSSTLFQECDLAEKPQVSTLPDPAAQNGPGEPVSAELTAVSRDATSAFGKRPVNPPRSDDSDPILQLAERVAGNFMQAFAGAVRQAQNGSVHEAESMLGTFLTMSSEIRGLSERVATLRQDLEAVVEREQVKALELAKIEAFKRGFEASQQRTTEALISLATASDDSSRMVTSQTEAISTIQREFKQLLERVNQQAKTVSQQTSAAAFTVSDLKTRLESTEGSLLDLRERLDRSSSSGSELDQRMATMELRLVSQAEDASVLDRAMQHVRLDLGQKSELAAQQAAAAASEASELKTRLEATERQLQDVHELADRSRSSRAELDEKIAALEQRLSSQGEGASTLEQELRQLHQELKQQVELTAQQSNGAASEAAELKTRLEATEGELRDLREQGERSGAPSDLNKLIEAMNTRLNSQAEAIRALHSASQGFAAQQEVLHALLQKVQELASGNQSRLQLPESL